MDRVRVHRWLRGFSKIIKVFILQSRVLQAFLPKRRRITPNKENSRKGNKIANLRISDSFIVKNLGLLCSYALDSRYMHLSLGISKSNTIEINGSKNHIIIQI